jgi:cyclophilin family peptidyl-prolyl cis-trans isomerase
MRKGLILLGCLAATVISGLALCPGCIPDPTPGPTYTLDVLLKGQGTVENQGKTLTEGSFEQGTKVVLDATPATDWHFDRWQGDSTGINARTLIDITRNTTVIAVFRSDVQYTLNVTIQGTGTVDPPGGSFNVDEEITLQATAGTGWKFIRWTGDLTGTNLSQPLTMNSDKSVTAVFEPDTTPYILTVNTQGQGTVSPNGGSYQASEPVTLTATPDPGWHFLFWQGDVTGYTSPTQVTMVTNKTVTAVFEQDAATYPLTIQVTGQGTVNPNGGFFNAGQQVTLTPTPAPGWYFDHWEDAITGSANPGLLTMNSTKTVTAVFHSLTQYTLTTQIQGQGTVSRSPYRSSYDVGEVVTVTAAPLPAWEFVRWFDGATGQTNPVQVTMDSSKMVIAQFARQSAPRVEFQTTLGTIVLQLNRTKAPITVDNFVQYVLDGFYDGKDGLGATIFHRVIPDFMAQGGGYTVDLTEKDTRAPILNEASNGLKNVRGAIAMARTSDPNSATSQFFINVVNNPFLDYGSTQSPEGYCVFGTVIQGMDVVDAIVAVPTQQDVPITPIIINSARVLP